MKKIILAALLLAGACKKDNNNSKSEAVVEAYLLPHQPVSIRISQKISRGAKDDLVAIKGLSAVLVQNHTSYPLKSSAQGVYTNPDISLHEKDSCHLYFEYHGKEVSAHTVIPDRPTGFTCNTSTLRFTNTNNPVFDPRFLEFTWNNPDHDLHMVVFEKEGYQPWWIQPAGSGAELFLRPFYTKPTNTATDSYQANGRLMLSDKYQMMLYHILPEYAYLFYGNDINSPNIINPANNIINALGVFAGMSTSDTLILNVVH